MPPVTCHAAGTCPRLPSRGRARCLAPTAGTRTPGAGPGRSAGSATPTRVGAHCGAAWWGSVAGLAQLGVRWGVGDHMDGACFLGVEEGARARPERHCQLPPGERPPCHTCTVEHMRTHVHTHAHTHTHLQP